MNFGITIDLCGGVKRSLTKHIEIVPEVLLIKKRAFVRLAKPSIFRVPMKEVLIVFTALN